MAEEYTRSAQDLDLLGRAVTAALEAASHLCRPGFTPLEMDEVVSRSLVASGVEAVLPGVRTPAGEAFGHALLVCVNGVAVNGKPTDRRFEPGDVVTLDTAARRGRDLADAAVSLVVHETRPRGEREPTPDESVRSGIRLVELGRTLTNELIDRLVPGARFAELAEWASRWASERDASLAPEAILHGIGPDLHAPPFVFPPGVSPSFSEAMGREVTADEVVTEGMVLAVEPVLVLGLEPVRLETDPDGWTRRTADGRMACYEERTVVVGAAGPRVVAGAARVPEFGPVPRRPQRDIAAASPRAPSGRPGSPMGHPDGGLVGDRAGVRRGSR